MFPSFYSLTYYLYTCSLNAWFLLINVLTFVSPFFHVINFMSTIHTHTHAYKSRVVCSVCDHSWFQSRDRLRTVSTGSELIPLPEQDRNRIASNIEAGRKPSYVGSIKFYVGNLDFRATEEDIYNVFKDAGQVGDVNLVTDHETGRSRGFAFVTMMDKESMDKCMELDGADINGRNINVKPPNN